MEGKEIDDLIKTIIQCAYKIRIYLAAGFLETVYQKALVLELKEKGIDVQTDGELPDRHSCRPWLINKLWR